MAWATDRGGSGPKGRGRPPFPGRGGRDACADEREEVESDVRGRRRSDKDSSGEAQLHTVHERANARRSDASLRTSIGGAERMGAWPADGGLSAGPADARAAARGDNIAPASRASALAKLKG